MVRARMRVLLRLCAAHVHMPAAQAMCSTARVHLRKAFLCAYSARRWVVHVGLIFMHL